MPLTHQVPSAIFLNTLGTLIVEGVFNCEDDHYLMERQQTGLLLSIGLVHTTN